MVTVDISVADSAMREHFTFDVAAVDDPTRQATNLLMLERVGSLNCFIGSARPV